MSHQKSADRCFNPFGLSNHSIRQGLRRLSNSLSEKLNLNGEYRVCSSCRKRLQNETPNFEENSSDGSNSNVTHVVNVEKEDSVNVNDDDDNQSVN